MINPVIERRFEDCSELVDAWKTFHSLFNDAATSENPDFSPENEQQFLNCKAKIAMLHDSLLESIKHDQGTAQAMLSIVNRSITLRHIKKMGDADKKKIEIEWHDCYLLLHETVSNLNEERERLDNINETSFKMNKIKQTIIMNIVWFFKSVYFKFIVAFAIIFGIYFFVPESGWSALRQAPGVGEPYKKYSDLKRSFGFDAPYSSLEKFKEEELLAESMPEGFSSELILDGDANDALANDTTFFDSLLEIGGRPAGEYLKTAEGYTKYRITDEDLGLDVTVNVLFWDSTLKAQTASRAFDNASRGEGINAMTIRSQYLTYNKENVLLILSDGPNDERENLLNKVFRY